MNASDTTAYTFNTASLEILAMVAGAFVLGALLCYLLKLTGLCCRRKQGDLSADQQITSLGRQSSHQARTTPVSAALGGSEGTAYEADLRSLLRGRPAEGDEAREVRQPQARPQATAPTPPSRPAAPVSKPTPASTAEALDLPDENHIDDLKKLEGIGSKIEALLNQHGIRSYAKLATMDRDELKRILESGGNQFRMHEPKSWPYQAELAAKKNWARLKEYQEFLISGQK